MWQPIETAPKDGTHIDLWCGEYGGREPNCRWNGKRSRWECYGQDSFDNMGWIALDYQPTHWMPLPEPPKP